MIISQFKIYGHKNVLCQHQNTIEFTKDKELTLRGDCILGVNADFNIDKKKLFQFKKIKVIIKTDIATDSFFADVNPNFDDEHELVFRKTNFHSKRTIGFYVTKTAYQIDKKIVDFLKDENHFADVIIEGIKEEK